MSVTAAIPADLTEQDLRELAERLRPYLGEGQPADAWLRGADQIAAYIAAPRWRVYALASAGRIPVDRDGSALVARKSKLDRWLSDGGGKRP